jgi:hypothetical protein
VSGRWNLEREGTALPPVGKMVTPFEVILTPKAEVLGAVAIFTTSCTDSATMICSCETPSVPSVRTFRRSGKESMLFARRTVSMLAVVDMEVLGGMCVGV